MDRCKLTASGVLRISKPGFDVNTAAPSDLLFDSAANALYRERAFYTLQITGNGSSRVSTTLNHGLGVVPLLIYGLQWQPSGNPAPTYSPHGDYNVWATSSVVGFGSAFALPSGQVAYAHVHLFTENV
jgi:hypothetical protein